ncbi:putative ATP-dependent RNA helicase [Euzebya pacifica]|uniref:Putative ATP-dependent RNA helicase n=1 Tax=Euzebya pacifica TaxID=1608957 RepID=A0A346XUK8_9ACTN|nr:DEAD/DEAH box helicase [Euzebya pacifica]AXV05905.1 putative ATP-dependent RNA helicase [Euzebya pacifica]
MSNATEKTFADFGVDATICESLAEVGIIHPFPIQELTLPLALTGADIIGQARTGTGKTLGFGLPMLQRVDTAKGLQALIIVPTRELCLQVSEDLIQAGKGRGVKVVAVYGGKAMQPQIDAIEGGAHVVVGTPGRLLDLSRRGHMDLSSCRGLVLDEADEMLDLGFLPDVEALIEQCADKRQTLLFSATMPSAIVGLARRYMTKPTFMRAEVEEVHVAPKTKQHFFSCHRMDKPAVVARILQTPNRGLCVIFCRTKRMADQLAEDLRDRDVAAQAIHSDLRQEARERALEKFRQGKTTVLCATEVAARGLDIDDVTHVINYDCPDDEKMYLHRIGRTGRAGADGVAITFAVWNELPRLEMIRRELDIEDEIHEVFSTSPLLDELFDLPPREEKKKVPSPPKARTGKQSRSRRRGEQSSDSRDSDKDKRSSRSEKADKPSRSSRSDDGDSRSSKGRDQSSSRSSRSKDDNGEGDEQTRSRTRTRTRRRVTNDGDDTGRATSSDRGKDSNDDADDDSSSTRTRSRSRSGSGDRTRSRDTNGRQDKAREDDGREDKGRSGDRSADRSADRSTDKASGKGRSPKAKADDRSDDRSEKADRGGRASKDDDQKDDSRGGRSRSRSRGGRDNDDRNGSSSKRNDGARSSSKKSSSRGGSSRNGGRDNDNDSRGGSRNRRGKGNGNSNRTRENDGSRARNRRSDIDADTARGDGQPRLKRRMDVVHLP